MAARYTYTFTSTSFSFFPQSGFLTAGIQRPIFDRGYLKCLQSDRVLLTFDLISYINKTGIVTQSGTEYQLDTIVRFTEDAVHLSHDEVNG